MYEDKTYENILSDMLARVPASLDKREGSVIWLALAPAAAELAQCYIELSARFDDMFGDTASRESLVRIAKDTKGILPHAATKAVWLLTASPINLDLVGTRVSCGSLNFTVLEGGKTAGTWIAECETAGEVGNTANDALIPIEYINGLSSCVLSELLIPGEDEEDTETFRARWRASFAAKGFGGNKADYAAKIKAIDGVGGCRVLRATNAAGETVGGHVLCQIIAADFSPPSSTLVAAVQNAMDPNEDGCGDGLVPIGHTCHIDGVIGAEINVTAVFTLISGISFADVKPQLEAAVRAYLLTLAKAWETTDPLAVRVSQIEYAMLSVDGVVDVTGTTLNNSAENILLTGARIPVLGNITEAPNG